MPSVVTQYLHHYLQTHRKIPKPSNYIRAAKHPFIQKLVLANVPHSLTNKITIHPPQPVPQNYYQLINPDVRKVIETSPGYYSRQYQFTLSNPRPQQIVVDIIYPYFESAGESEPHPAKMDGMFMKCVHRIYAWLFAANEYRKPGCSDKLHIWLYMTHAPKLLDLSNKLPLDETHANTAFTYPCSSEGNIFIYREEEWFKVLIHETFHSYSLDFCSDNGLAGVAESRIHRAFPRVSGRQLRVYETYCETMAEILNLVYSYPAGEFNSCLHYERQFGVFQMVKVLRYMGLTYADLFVEGEYHEKTYIFSYYVLKCVCLYYADEFMDWRVSQPNLLRIEHTRECIDAFTGFIVERAMREEFVEYVSQMEKYYDKKRGENLSEKKLEDLTMRMTVFG